jgi:hypothetical protein
MNSPLDPETTKPERRVENSREMDRSEGLGAIIAVVAVAAVIIVGMLYIMQPPAETPGTVTGQAPSVTTPEPGK